MRKDSSGAIYGMAVIGAVVYYARHAVTFSAGLVGISQSDLLARCPHIQGARSLEDVGLTPHRIVWP
jgi:hypothetical protein